MPILVGDKTRVLVQGITGNTGRVATKIMLEYDTKVVAGVTPGKGGQEVEGVPVYDSVKEAVENHPEINLSAVFVPPSAARESIIEAVDNGIKLINCLTEGIAISDTAFALKYAEMHGTRVVGPASIGIISPEACRVGVVGGSKDIVERIYKKGFVGVISRSGGMTNETSWMIRQAGLGQSTAVGIGGDVLIGTDFADLLMLFEEDPQTKCVVIFSEPGGTYEDRIAECIRRGEYTKPLVAFIAGRFMENMPKGMKFGHAGTLIEGQRNTASHKMSILQKAGVVVTENYEEIGDVVKTAIG